MKGHNHWLSAHDELVRESWVKANGLSSSKPLVRLLAKQLGRTPAAIVTRGYTLGLRVWTPEQAQARQQRLKVRKEVIEQAFITGAPRRPLAQKLGMNECSLNLYRWKLIKAGHSIPPVPWWTSRKTESPEVRFWHHVTRSGEDLCWEWNGGRFALGSGHSTLAHRFSYQLHRGAPEHKRVFQRCKNLKCVNPNHLYILSAKGPVEFSNWKTLQNAAYREYQEVIQAEGILCKCGHHASYHYGDVCTQIYPNGGGCLCATFIAVGTRSPSKHDASAWTLSLDQELGSDEGFTRLHTLAALV